MFGTSVRGRSHTLFAGRDFSLSKNFCDWVLVALMAAEETGFSERLPTGAKDQRRRGVQEETSETRNMKYKCSVGWRCGRRGGLGRAEYQNAPRVLFGTSLLSTVLLPLNSEVLTFFFT